MGVIMMVVSRVIMIGEIVVVVVAIFKEETADVLHVIDILIGTHATPPRRRSKFFGGSGKRLVDEIRTVEAIHKVN